MSSRDYYIYIRVNDGWRHLEKRVCHIGSGCDRLNGYSVLKFFYRLLSAIVKGRQEYGVVPPSLDEMCSKLGHLYHEVDRYRIGELKTIADLPELKAILLEAAGFVNNQIYYVRDEQTAEFELKDILTRFHSPERDWQPGKTVIGGYHLRLKRRK
jgi:hypothetical protein